MCKYDSKCFCHGGKMGRLLTPAILLLLAEKASHGYELADRYQKLGLTEADSDVGAIYRTLKPLEKEGFVEFSWETRSQGPAKKVYHITPSGRNLLHGWAQEIILEGRSSTAFWTG
ncbi:MAG: PadR family transcriptional regulator [Actinomycetota bacterium]|nr:PadR family transcriptional regulator [Actinomycetota bacterium]